MRIKGKKMEMGCVIGFLWSHEDNYCLKVVDEEGGTELALAFFFLKRRPNGECINVQSVKLRRKENTFLLGKLK